MIRTLNSFQLPSNDHDMISRMGGLNFVHPYLESFRASVIYAIFANSNKSLLKDFHICNLL